MKEEAALRKELGLWDLVLAQVLCVAFAGKICAVVVVSNMVGVLIYRLGQARNTLE